MHRLAVAGSGCGAGGPMQAGQPPLGSCVVPTCRGGLVPRTRCLMVTGGPATSLEPAAPLDPAASTGAYSTRGEKHRTRCCRVTVADQVLTESQTQFLKGNPDAGSPAYIRYSVWRPAPRCASVPRWRCLHMAPLPDRRRACVRGGRCLRLSSAAAGWRARSASPCRRP